jgi:hypothetical protein
MWLVREVAILEREAVRLGGQRSAERSSPEINGSKNVEIHPLRASLGLGSANSTPKGPRDSQQPAHVPNRARFF